MSTPREPGPIVRVFLILAFLLLGNRGMAALYRLWPKMPPVPTINWGRWNSKPRLRSRAVVVFISILSGVGALIVGERIGIKGAWLWTFMIGSGWIIGYLFRAITGPVTLK